MARVRELPIFSYVQTAAGSAMTFLLDFLLVMVFLIFLVLAFMAGSVVV